MKLIVKNNRKGPRTRGKPFRTFEFRYGKICAKIKHENNRKRMSSTGETAKRGMEHG